jgi:predicted RND superfamily exporter protein
MRVTVHKTGAAIIQTTLILVAGIAVFYFSRFILLGRAGFVVTMGLIAATTTTLVVIPAVLKLSPRLLARIRRRYA